MIDAESPSEDLAPDGAPADDVAAAVHRIVVAQLGLAAPPDGEELAARLDSVQRMSLVVAIEDHFQVCFSPEDDERARSLSDVVAIVQELLRDSPG